MEKYKNAIRAVAFLAVFCLVFLHVQELVTPDYNWPSSNDRYGNGIRGFYVEPEDSLQVIWLGTSHMRCAISPMAVYRESGIRSYNLATNGQMASLSYAYLKAIMEHSSPKLVFLDASACFKSRAKNRAEGVWHKVIDTLAWYRFKDKYIISSDLADLNGWSFSERASGLLPLLFYHNNYLLAESDYGADNREKLELMKGYCFRTKHAALKHSAGDDADAGASAGGKKKRPVRVSDFNRAYVAGMIELCREHQCEFVLTKIPVNAVPGEYRSYWSREKHDVIADLAEELGCRFIDLNYEDVGIDWNMDTTDGGCHMNMLGARKSSQFLARWIAENYDFAEPADAAVTESWDRQLALYDHEERLYDLMMETDPDAYMRRLSEGGYTVFAAATGTFGEAWSGAALETLADVVGAESEWREALRSPDGGAFVAAGSGGEKLRGNMDAKKCAAKGSLASGEDYELSGKVAKSGGASIRVGSQEYKCEGEGLLIVVYDDALGCVVDSVTFSEKKGAIKAGRDGSAGKMYFRKSLARYEEEALKGL